MKENDKENYIITYRIPMVLKGHKTFTTFGGAKAFQRYLIDRYELSSEDLDKHFRIIYGELNDDAGDAE